MKAILQKAASYFKEKGVGYYLTVLTIVFAIVAICMFNAVGEDKTIATFAPAENTTVLCLVLCIVLAAVSMVIDLIPVKWSKELVKPIRYAAYLVCFYSLFQFIFAHINYIANVFVAIDGNEFTADFKGTLVFIILTCVFTLLASCLNFWRPWGKKAAASVSAGEAPAEDAQPEEIADEAPTETAENAQTEETAQTETPEQESEEADNEE